MPISFIIIPDQRTAYIRANGKIAAMDIISQGAKMFAQSEWENGFNILCDYREVTDLDIDVESVDRISNQDRRHEPLFDTSKCAVVASEDLFYGFSRMWEAISADTKLTKEVFRDINDAVRWLDMESKFMDSIVELM